MKNHTVLLFGIIAMLTVSCQSVISTIYGTNRNHTFNSRQELADFYETKNKLDTDRIYFFNTEKDKSSFYDANPDQLKYLPYYALVKNDSIRIDDSTIDSGCVGVAANFVLSAERKEVPFNLKELNVYNLKGEKLELNKGRETLILLITTQMGKFTGRDTRYITDQIEKEGRDTDYIYINIDRLPDLNPNDILL